MLDILSQQVNIGDKVFIAHGKLLYETVFTKESKTTRTFTSTGNYGYFRVAKFYTHYVHSNNNGSRTYTKQVDDISQEPCKRIIKC